MNCFWIGRERWSFLGRTWRVVTASQLYKVVDTYIIILTYYLASLYMNLHIYIIWQNYGPAENYRKSWKTPSKTRLLPDDYNRWELNGVIGTTRDRIEYYEMYIETIYPMVASQTKTLKMSFHKLLFCVYFAHYTCITQNLTFILKSSIGA